MKDINGLPTLKKKSFFGRMAAARRKQQTSHNTTTSSLSATQCEASSPSKSDSDVDSEDIDSTALDIDEIVTSSNSNYLQSALQPNITALNIISQKKKDISNDDSKTVAKRQHNRVTSNCFYSFLCFSL